MTAELLQHEQCLLSICPVVQAKCRDRLVTSSKNMATHMTTDGKKKAISSNKGYTFKIVTYK